MPCLRARQSLHLSGYRQLTLKLNHPSAPMQAAFEKVDTSLCDKTETFTVFQNAKCHLATLLSAEQSGLWVISTCISTTVVPKLWSSCVIFNDVALRYHTLHLTRAGVTQEDFQIFAEIKKFLRTAWGTSGMSLALGLRYKPSAGNHDSRT